jgi:hypothetical protein
MQVTLSKIIILLLCALASVQCSAQISGKIIQKDSSQLQDAAITIKGTSEGTVTKRDGTYNLKSAEVGDTIIITKVAFEPLQFIVQKAGTQPMQLLQIKQGQLQEIRVTKKGSIITRIMNKVQARKPENNPFNEPALETTVYNTIAVRLYEFQQIKNVAPLVQKIIKEYREANPTADTSYIPVFLSEAVSDNFYKNKPQLNKEIIKNTQVRTIGISTDDVVNDVIGNSFQVVNFYNEYVRILGKDFVSPISNAWKANFFYGYLGEEEVDGRTCYHLSYSPINKRDVAFTGEMWIDTSSYAIYKINAKLDEKANLNFIKDFAIEQYFDIPKGYDKLFPTESVLDIGLAPTKKAKLGMKAHISNSCIVVKKAEPKEDAFYVPSIERLPESITKNDTFWTQVRSYSEASEIKTTLAQIKSLEHTPTVEFADKLFRFVVGGWAPTRKTLQFGPYFSLIAPNNVEGIRNSIGFRARDILNKNASVSGYVAYGHKDKKIKWGAEASYIVSRKPWIVLNAKAEHDIRRIGLTNFQLTENTLAGQLFALSNHIGNLRRAYETKSYVLGIKHDIAPGISHRVLAVHETFDPLYNFRYFEHVPAGAANREATHIDFAEINYELRYSKGEVLVRHNTKRALKLKKNRDGFIYVFRYTYGQAGDNYKYQYHKFYGEISRNIRAYKYGAGEMILYGGYTPSSVPYPLLFTQVGNESPVYGKYAFNTMRFFEFTTDKYVALFYNHNFQGYLTNRIPLIRALNLRTHFSGRALWGEQSKDNDLLIPQYDPSGRPVVRSKSLDYHMPFLESGVGVSNIFKFLRLDAMYRHTHRDKRTPWVFIKGSVLLGL